MFALSADSVSVTRPCAPVGLRDASLQQCRKKVASSLTLSAPSVGVGSLPLCLVPGTLLHGVPGRQRGIVPAPCAGAAR